MRRIQTLRKISPVTILEEEATIHGATPTTRHRRATTTGKTTTTITTRPSRRILLGVPSRATILRTTTTTGPLATTTPTTPKQHSGAEQEPTTPAPLAPPHQGLALHVLSMALMAHTIPRPLVPRRWTARQKQKKTHPTTCPRPSQRRRVPRTRCSLERVICIPIAGRVRSTWTTSRTRMQGLCSNIVLKVSPTNVIRADSTAQDALAG